MPLFNRNSDAPAESDTKPQKSSSFFNRSRTSQDSPPAEGRSSTSSRNGSRLMGRSGDPAIAAARQKVADAEKAEKQADQALMAARASVRDAKQHIKTLEKEAAEEQRRAAAKAKETKAISKSSDRLGRHS